MNSSRWSVLLVVALLLTACTKGGGEWVGRGPGEESYWPAEGWRTSIPEAQGMDSMRLADMLAEIEQHGYDIDSVSVVRHGHLVLDSSPKQ